jgi:leucyl-tRNA synthetase
MFLKIIAPFAPHMSEEVWTSLGNKKSIHLSVWPVSDKSKTVESVVKIGVQVSGRVRGVIEVEIEAIESRVVEIAKANPEINKWIEDKKIVKIIYVPGKILNLVVIG